MRLNGASSSVSAPTFNFTGMKLNAVAMTTTMTNNLGARTALVNTGLPVCRTYSC